MALTKDITHDFGASLQVASEARVAASTRIYKGAYAGIVVGTGHMRGLVAGDAFGGVAMEPCDNLLGAAGAKRVKLATKGILRKETVTGVADATSIGAAVYASADDALTLTSTNNTLVGSVNDWISGALCDVAFEAVTV